MTVASVFIGLLYVVVLVLTELFEGNLVGELVGEAVMAIGANKVCATGALLGLKVGLLAAWVVGWFLRRKV